MANIVYIGTSVDGFIAAKDGGIEWLMEIPNPTGSDYGFAEFMQRIDALVMGRKTFETALSFETWPYAKKVFVLSNTITDVPLHLDAEVIRGDLKHVVQTLNARGYQNLYIDGGQTVQGFLREDLLDELIITRIPIVLGDGIPLFGAQDHSLKLEHVATQVYDGGLVKSHYRRVKSR